MKVERGYITPALIYLEKLMAQLPLRDRLTGLKFDEMKLQKLAMYEPALDTLLGPHDYVQQIIVRGIFGDWQYPIYLDYDMALTKNHYMECILRLEAINAKVLISACDQGPRNVGLGSELGISTNNVKVTNPYDPSRFVLFSYDIKPS